MKKYGFEEKSTEQLLKEANEAVKNGKEMTEEELDEYNEEFGYGQDVD